MKHSGAHNALEQTMHLVFLLFGVVTIGFVLLISIYLIAAGLPAIREIGLVDFLFGKTWASTAAEPKFGILPSFSHPFTALRGHPHRCSRGLYDGGVFSPRWPPRCWRGWSARRGPAGGHPSVVYGLVGMIILVPGSCTASAWPISLSPGGHCGASHYDPALHHLLSETALKAVPREYEGGVSGPRRHRDQTYFRVSVPAARAASPPRSSWASAGPSAKPWPS